MTGSLGGLASLSVPRLDERPKTQTASQMAQAMVTIRKLGGVLNIAEAPRPTQTENTLMTADIAIASTGRGVSAMAVAAGVTIRANNSSVPTT